MKQPSLLEYSVLVIVCLISALCGLYLLANFSRLFRNSVRNELLRKNISAWLIIFFMTTATLPLGSGLYYLLLKHGWSGIIWGHLASTTACTLFIYNPVRIVSQNRKIKKASFVNQTAVILIVLIVTILAVNIPFGYWIWREDWKSVWKYVITQSIYSAVIIGLVHAVLRYLDLERKRKFDEKELEVSRLRELKTKAELDALHSKINPHFLYNALNSIADLSITDGKKGRKMTIALADLFRYSINHSDNNYSTVKDEVMMAEVYLQIEKIRFEDQLNYTIDISPAAEYYLIPRFLLQPLVENAVKHGLKATGKMTELLLEVKLDGSGLVVNVADNGPAFPEELNPGYGVKSVFDKLDLLFPDQYAVQFSNTPVKQVTVHINKLIKNEPGIKGYIDR